VIFMIVMIRAVAVAAGVLMWLVHAGVPACVIYPWGVYNPHA